MKLIDSKIKSFAGKQLKIKIDDLNLDFAKAKDIARQKAKEVCDDPMLLSWYQGDTGESYPNIECGRGDQPAWILYAESRGADIAVDINEGQYIFLYLELP
jgi:hypothetical protein